MKTYNVKTGDVVKFPNGIEVNYDPVGEVLVVISTLSKRRITAQWVTPQQAYIGCDV